MHSILSESVDAIDRLPVIPDISHPIAPSDHANVGMSGSSVTLPDTPRCSHAPFLFLPHDEERSQSTFSDGEDTMEEHAHDKLTRAMIHGPHAFGTVVHGNHCPLVQDTDTCQQPVPFRIPDRPGNAATPPVSRRLSASVARRNRLFALDNNGAVVTQADELGVSGALPLVVEMEGQSGIQTDGGVRKADHILGETLKGWTESDSASLKPADISIQCDNPGSKVKAYLTIH